MSEGLDLFGGHAIEDIPEGYNLEAGVYPECEIESAKAMKAKSGRYGLGINFKDVSDEGFGLTAFQWLGIPAPADRAQYLLRDLKALGLQGAELVAIAKCVSGTDPDEADVNIDGINDVLADLAGRAGTVTVTEYTNKRDGSKGSNVSFKLNEDAIDPELKEEFIAQTTPSAPADTSDWFGNS